jgi:hypothetical protein
MASNDFVSRPWLFDEDTIIDFDLNIHNSSLVLAAALVSLCPECEIYVARPNTLQYEYYFAKFPSHISKYPYVNIHGAWTKRGLIQNIQNFWNDGQNIDIHLVTEIPERIHPAAMRSVLVHATAIMALIRHYQAEDAREVRVDAKNVKVNGKKDNNIIKF